MSTISEVTCNPKYPSFATKSSTEYSQLSQHRQLPDESWGKYRKTWDAYDVPVPPEEIFPALRDWENTYKKYWDREAENLRFPVNPGVEIIYSNVKNIFRRVCLRDN